MKEKWREYYTDGELKRLQDIEMSALKAFIDVCGKFNLEYFVYGGTLLGVEKYNGMIPWDDAMDFYERAHTTIVNGALFFPSILSGYGIIGTIFFIVYAVKAIKTVFIKRFDLNRFALMFFISIAAIFLAGLQGEFTGKYFIWFIFSIPYAVFKKESLKDGQG